MKMELELEQEKHLVSCFCPEGNEEEWIWRKKGK